MDNKEIIKNMPFMSPLTSRMDASKEKGFTENFEVVSATTMVNHDTGMEYQPTDATIVDHYRFEGVSDPGDNNILYLIETSDGIKGTLVAPYGSDCPAHVADFVAKIPQMDKLHAGISPDTKNAQTPLDVTDPSNTTSAG
ncbi:MAG: hypothetical protein Q7T20_15970 [Saprospiraceae bacterium]|nr:hypothetical protein [Saprospiraceae bacterium]